MPQSIQGYLDLGHGIVLFAHVNLPKENNHGSQRQHLLYREHPRIEGIEETKIQSIVDRLVSLMNNPQKLSPTIYLVPEIHSLVEELYMRKSNSFSETNIYKFLMISDLRPELISRVRKLALIQKPGHPWEIMNDEELLRSAKLYRKEFKTGEEGYTLAAALLFGMDEVIQNILPAYKTDALVRIANTDLYDDRLEVRTNLIESYDL